MRSSDPFPEYSEAQLLAPRLVRLELFHGHLHAAALALAPLVVAVLLCGRLRWLLQGHSAGGHQRLAVPVAGPARRTLTCWRTGCGRSFMEGQGDQDDELACGLCAHFANLPSVLK